MVGANLRVGIRESL